MYVSGTGTAVKVHGHLLAYGARGGLHNLLFLSLSLNLYTLSTWQTWLYFITRVGCNSRVADLNKVLIQKFYHLYSSPTWQKWHLFIMIFQRTYVIYLFKMLSKLPSRKFRSYGPHVLASRSSSSS